MADPLTHHGDDELAPGLLDLAVNVSTEPQPAWLSSAVLSACARLDAYPDARRARAAVAARHGRSVDEVLLTVGAAEAFTLIARGLPAGRACVVHPQFTEPEVALRAAGWDVHRVVLDASDGFRLHPALVPADCTLVVVGNPTNPTGTLHPAAALRALRAPGRTVVVDEAFLDSVPSEPQSLADDAGTAGVVVVRSLTKTWGLAGLRVGYLLGEPDLITALAHGQPRWAVSAPALAAAVVCSTPVAVAEAGRRAVVVTHERERLRAELRQREMTVADESSGPFLLAHGPDDLHGRLRAEGIAVRRGDTFPGLGPGWIRVAVRDRATRERLLGALDRILNGGEVAAPRPGTVTLVGGGPGPDGLMTLDGLVALQRADVVVHDRLAPLGLLEHLCDGVEVIDVAKNPRGRAVPQQRINELLVEHALAGRDVVRLKGGDPFVFGRGFEELQACAAAGVPTRVVPGISSAVAGPALAGVPVTHRGTTHGVAVVSGHLAPDHPDSLVDWAALARSGLTLVVLMGVTRLSDVADALLAGGLPAATPAALVENAGAPGQRVVRTTLDTLGAAAAEHDLQPPAIAVVGDVAGLGDPADLRGTGHLRDPAGAVDPADASDAGVPAGSGSR